MVKPKMIFGLSQEIFFVVITWNPESNCTCGLKNHSLFHRIPWRYQNYQHDVRRYVGEKCWRLLECWWRSVNCQIRGPWTGLTRFTKLSEKPPDSTWCGGRLTRKQTTSRPDKLWPEIWKDMSDASKRKEKRKWAIEKPKLENVRRLRDIFFIDPDDEEFKRLPNQHRETCGNVGQHKTKYACLVEADGSVRIRMEGSQSKNHEDHISGKGVNSMGHYNLVHKFIPMLEALKIPDAKAAVEKEWEICLLHKNVKRSKSGLLRNQSSTMPEDDVVFISLILKTRNSNLLWKTLVESWKFRCQQQSLVKLHCAEVAGKLAAQLENTWQNMLVLLKLTNPWESEWKGLLTDIMKITLHEKVWIH